MKKKILCLILLVMMLCLTACPDGGGATELSSDTENQTLYSEDFGEDNDVSAENKSTNEDDLFAKSKDEQKLVYNGSATIGTDSIKKSYKKVTEKMKEYDAFFESMNEYSDSKTMQIRIPKKDYMNFYNSLSDMGGEVISSNVNIQDKTKTYTDNERRIEILQTEYDELKELMNQATSVEDILTIKDRMANVTYELETLQSANNTIDYDVDYGSLELTLQLNGTHDEESFGHQIKEAFSGGFYLLKQLFLIVIYMWWAILIAAYILFAANKKLWPFKKKVKLENSPKTEEKDA